MNATEERPAQAVVTVDPHRAGTPSLQDLALSDERGLDGGPDERQDRELSVRRLALFELDDNTRRSRGDLVVGVVHVGRGGLDADRLESEPLSEQVRRLEGLASHALAARAVLDLHGL